MPTENSKQIFEEMTATGALSRLQEKVYEAFLELGPVHNLRLLEYLQQKEKVNKKKDDWIQWTAQNCWPRVTEMVGRGFLMDLGTYRISWHGKQKTLHVRCVAGDMSKMDKTWEKRAVTNRQYPIAEKKPTPAEAARSVASQAGRQLQACRQTKRKVNKKQKTFNFEGKTDV